MAADLRTRASLFRAEPLEPRLLLATISGTKYDDRDANGLRHPLLEPGLGGWTIYVDSNNNGVMDAAEPRAVTAANGSYTITATLVPRRSYTVREVAQAGWRVTAPAAGEHTVTPDASDDAITGINFGNTRRALVRGTVFNDSNDNGVFDRVGFDRESGLQGRTVFADADNDGAPDEGEATFTTDAGGDYVLTPAAGSYTIRELSYAGWRRTAPPAGSFAVNLAAGETRQNLDFGDIFETRDLVGVSFTLEDFFLGRYTIRNAGTGDAGTFTLGFFLSDDQTIDAADIPLGNRTVNGVPRYGQVTGETELLVLSTAHDPLLTDNQYWVGMIIDATNLVAETNESNNQNVQDGVDRVEIFSEAHLPSPANGTALRATPVTPNSITNGSFLDEWIDGRDIDAFRFAATAGMRLAIDIDALGAMDTYMRVYDVNFTVVAENDNAGAPGEFANSGDSFLEFVVPASATYYVVVAPKPNHIADPRVLAGRSDVQSSARADYVLTIAPFLPDLATLAHFHANEFTEGPGGVARLERWSVQNIGFAPSAPVVLGFYLSDDTTLSTADVLFHTVDVPALAPLQRFDSATEPYEVTLPAPDPLATDNQYYLGIIADPGGTLAEVTGTKANNATFVLSRNLQFPVPISSEANASSPANGALAHTGSFSFDTTRVSTGTIGDEWIGPRDIDIFQFRAAPGQRFGFDLDTPDGSSLDAHFRIYDFAGTFIAENDDGAAPGESLRDDPYIEFPGNLPASFANLYKLVVSAVGNHTVHPGALNGRVPASTGAYTLTMMGPDLAGTIVASSGVSPVPGDGRVRLDYSVRNLGLLAGPSQVTFYLSQDQTITPASDVLLATLDVPELANLSNHNATIELDLPDPDPFRTNNRYWIGMRVDAGGTVVESDEANNLNRADGADRLAISAEAHVPSPLAAPAVTATPLTVDSTLASAIGDDEWIGPFDIDTYAVTVSAGQRLRFDLDRTGGTLDSFIRIFDSAFLLQNANNDGAAPDEAAGTTDSFVQHTFTAAGVYYVVVNAAGNNNDARTLAGRVAAGTGGYTLAVSNATPRVVGRHVFYNNSSFDGGDPAANVGDDSAIATNKTALQAGGGAGLANLSSYSRGLNGIMIDLANSTANLAVIDFAFSLQTISNPSVWVDAPSPAAFAVRELAVPDQRRATFTWADGQIQNAWLRVSVLAGARTGLSAPDVFYFGNLTGEVTGPFNPARVGAPDVTATRGGLSRAGAAIVNPYDHNRDGWVNIRDVEIARSNLGSALPPLAFPQAPVAPAAVRPVNRAAPLRRASLGSALLDESAGA